uniref:Kisspeptin n=1 Tax=Chrysiptera cyanea TaxID=83874 RepID=V5YWA5_CHRCY|nr:kisspeptin [Chrysiptera cyanea]
MMPPLVVVLMVAALSAEVHTSISLKSTFYRQDQAILKVLRDLSHASTVQSAKNPGNSLVEFHSADGTFPRPGWWIAKMIFPQTVKKRQDLSSYNFNSYGLRYGK